MAARERTGRRGSEWKQWQGAERAVNHELTALAF